MYIILSSMSCQLVQVAILNGITMGGGAGVSIPGGFRLATGRTVGNMDVVE